MADVTISGLAAGTALTGVEPFPAVQSSNTVKITAAQIAAYAWTTPTLTGSVTLTSIVTPATNTNLSITPNGTGSILANSTTNIGLASPTITVGASSADAIVTTNGANNLVLRTNGSAANQGTITINDGINGNISISPDGTGRVLALKGIDVTGDITATTTIAATTSVTAGAFIRSSGPTSGVGYSSGAGGTVVQATSNTTPVTLNKVCGTITTFSGAIGADSTINFLLQNTAISTGDVLIINHVSGGTIGAYTFNPVAVPAGAYIYIHNVTAGSLTESLTIAFAVIKAVTA